MLKETFTIYYIYIYIYIIYSNYTFSKYLITSPLYRGAEVQCVLKKLKLI